MLALQHVDPNTDDTLIQCEKVLTLLLAWERSVKAKQLTRVVQAGLGIKMPESAPTLSFSLEGRRGYLVDAASAIRTQDTWSGMTGATSVASQDSSTPTMLLLEIKSASVDDAIEQCNDLARLMRGIIELRASPNTIFVRANPDAPECLIPPCNALAWFESGTVHLVPPNTHEHTAVRPVWAPVTLEKTHLDDVAKRLARHEAIPEPGSTRELISVLLRLYASARDQPSRFGRLLHLWQIVETITMGLSGSGDTREIVSRFVPFVCDMSSNNEFGLKSWLSNIAKHRNAIVHTGARPEITPDSLFLLRVLCGFAIEWIDVEVDSIPSPRHLAEFFRVLKSDKAENDLRRHALKAVEVWESRKSR